ncbi:MAG: triose-phosphate isomerase [Candidatus Aenigmarchaeota archaeon ex4484_52]|nr:MAG: triose-phosphate isomerase [Candidatus Aenigmarchaeota archaeon ex4484_52]
MLFQKPIIAINLKTYQQGLGENAVTIAKAIEEINPNNNAKYTAILCPQAIDIRLVCSQTKIPVFAQHGDAYDFGRNTGCVLIKSLKQAGIKGLIINHNEHKLLLSTIEKTIKLAREEKLYSICCADTVDQAKAISCFNPDYVAVEPPELIGTDISIAKKDPKIIKEIIKKINFINPVVRVLIGAGIKTRKDIDVCIEFGANGVLLASGVVCSKKISDVLFDFFA